MRLMAAADTQQVFVILGSFGALRPALLRRGWVERPVGAVLREEAMMGFDLSGVEFARHESPFTPLFVDERDEKDALQTIAELLTEHPPDLIWAGTRDDLDTRTLRPTQIINYVRKNTGITTQVCSFLLFWSDLSSPTLPINSWSNLC